MSAEITHRLDPETRQYRQIVSPAHLRRILRRYGDDLARPQGFTDDDEWDVGEDGENAD